MFFKHTNFFSILQNYNNSILQEEREYLENSSSSSGSAGGASAELLPLPPLAEILTSPPLWAQMLAFFGNYWSLFLLLTLMPTYLSRIHNLDLKSVRNDLTKRLIEF